MVQGWGAWKPSTAREPQLRHLGPGERPQSLTADEQRMLTLLGLLGGAKISAEHIGAVAGVANAGQQLDELVERGWVESRCSRYRLVRSASPVAAPFLVGKLTAALLDHLIEYALHEASPRALASEAEVIEAALGLAALDARWEQALDLACASEPPLARAGAWLIWTRVLQRGLQAARSLGDEAAEAHMLHQLGSVALCLGDVAGASAQLREALRIRQRIGDREGVDVTRHNIEQLGDGAPFWSGDDIRHTRETSLVLVGGRATSTRRPSAFPGIKLFFQRLTKRGDAEVN